MFLSVVDMDGCSMDVVCGTACTLCRVQDLDVGLALSLVVMARQEEFGCVARIAGPTPLSRGRRLVEGNWRQVLDGRVALESSHRRGYKLQTMEVLGFLEAEEVEKR
jgi:hypothetical protein